MPFKSVKGTVVTETDIEVSILKSDSNFRNIETEGGPVNAKTETAPTSGKSNSDYYKQLLALALVVVAAISFLAWELPKLGSTTTPPPPHNEPAPAPTSGAPPVVSSRDFARPLPGGRCAMGGSHAGEIGYRWESDRGRRCHTFPE